MIIIIIGASATATTIMKNAGVVEMLLMVKMLKMMKQVCHCLVTEEDEVHNIIKLQTILCNDSATMGKTLQVLPP